jgi:hypothetical protein
MLLKTTFTLLLAALGELAPMALAHPGEMLDKRIAIREANMRHTFADINSRALGKCDSGPDSIARKERAMKRRLETFQKLRAERGLSEGKRHYLMLPCFSKISTNDWIKLMPH